MLTQILEQPTFDEQPTSQFKEQLQIMDIQLKTIKENLQSMGITSDIIEHYMSFIKTTQ